MQAASEIALQFIFNDVTLFGIPILFSANVHHPIRVMDKFNIFLMEEVSQYKDIKMNKIAASLLALYTMSFVGAFALSVNSASAACPQGTRYDCTTTYNGKQSCGCR